MAIAMGWHKPDNVAGSSAPAIMVGLFVATGGLLFGYDTGYALPISHFTKVGFAWGWKCARNDGWKSWEEMKKRGRWKHGMNMD